MPQDESDLELADRDFGGPRAQDVLCYISHGAIDPDQVAEASVVSEGINVDVDVREHGGELQHSLREDASPEGVERLHPLQDVEQNVVRQRAKPVSVASGSFIASCLLCMAFVAGERTTN